MDQCNNNNLASASFDIMNEPGGVIPGMSTHVGYRVTHQPQEANELVTRVTSVMRKPQPGVLALTVTCVTKNWQND